MKHLKSLAVCFTLCMLLLSVAALSQAPVARAASNISQMGVHIDLSHAVPDLGHPVALDYPCPGQPHASVGSGNINRVSVHFSCNTSKRKGGPNMPGRPYCSSGPYLLTVRGQSTWYASNSSANVASWVQYYYCPSPGYPNGLNWSYGREYPLNGCTNLASGAGWGANMESSTHIIEPDGDSWQWFNNICAGHNYVQDYSEAGDGSLLWQVWMDGYTDAGNCQAKSPVPA